MGSVAEGGELMRFDMLSLLIVGIFVMDLLHVLGVLPG